MCIAVFLWYFGDLYDPTTPILVPLGIELGVYDDKIAAPTPVGYQLSDHSIDNYQFKLERAEMLVTNIFSISFNVLTHYQTIKF